MPPKDTIPYGYCHCGCGQKTPLARQGCTERGWVAGEPIRYIHGHNRRGRYDLDPNASSKTCTLCGEDKPLESFTRKASSRDGRTSWCKPCAAAYYRDYYKRHAQKHYARTQSWKKANPEMVRAIKQRRRAAEMGQGGPFTASEWSDILERYGNVCLCCGMSGDDIKLTADHVVPLSQGGRHEASNIQPLCQSCNARKNTRTIDYRPTLNEQPEGTSPPHRSP